MARLLDSAGRTVTLQSPHIMGRARNAQTTLASPDVSGQHFVLNWDGKTWTARDLGSLNGTWVDGRRLEARELAVLRVGSKIVIGASVERFEVVDLDAPVARASCGDTVVEGTPAQLALPNDDEPVAFIELFEHLGWVVTVGDEDRPLRSDDVVELEGRSWRLSLPEGAVRTAASRPPSAVACRFRVSRDEEFVEVTVIVGHQRHDLPPRTYHELLLALARARLDDARLPPSEQGWVYTADLVRQLRISPSLLYVSIFRARKELEALGVADAMDVVERRPTTRQIRLGIADLVVERR